MEIIILGVPYTVQYKSPMEDKFLRECDGYCDKSSHKIVINTENGDLDDFPGIRSNAYGMKLFTHSCLNLVWVQIGSINL